MSLQFNITISRYRNGERRTSTPQWVTAETFDGALRAANHIVHGLRSADPDSTYEVRAISSHYSGAICCDGARMFETRKELEARLYKETEQ